MTKQELRRWRRAVWALASRWPFPIFCELWHGALIDEGK
jgi:hypothetical protein